MKIKILCNERGCHWNCKLAFRRPFCACAHVRIDDPSFNPFCNEYLGRKKANLKLEEPFINNGLRESVYLIGE